MFRILQVILVLSLAPNLGFAAASTNGTCYYLNGDVASDHVPCKSGDNVVNCCDSRAVCLSNGMCLMQGSMGLSLGRGSCNDPNWSPACYAPCRDAYREGGVPIFPVTWNEVKTQYCCGKVELSNGKTTCRYGDPFTIAEGTVIPGVAYLSNVTYTGSIENTTTCDNSTSSTLRGPSSSNRGFAIGVGVGVPLGVIALLSLAWALWERRKFSQMKASTPMEGAYIGPYRPAQRPVELSATGSGAAELDSQSEPKHIDFRAEEPIESERHA
ncbi:uncharacterized protein N7496_001859 [Penicillium cataractarum]|uniref:Mid2 domain-containing protein n=1 Tax=Penicillium cataractarum TaxID=2100454 RepID=A0A9W9VWS1_9EURO|nr:uncharacterized protein N7496_001859 [Penicillium cataractarum]KAJ5390791.1 hypothetical protein N7496_001859 [Penicillium cataractarum]